MDRADWLIIGKENNYSNDSSRFDSLSIPKNLKKFQILQMQFTFDIPIIENLLELYT